MLFLFEDMTRWLLYLHTRYFHAGQCGTYISTYIEKRTHFKAKFSYSASSGSRYLHTSLYNNSLINILLNKNMNVIEENRIYSITLLKFCLFFLALFLLEALVFTKFSNEFEKLVYKTVVSCCCICSYFSNMTLKIEI